MKYASLISQPVPQSEPLDERQAKNNGGGFVYTIDKWGRLDRFLVLGSDAPTYYQTARDLTVENAKVVAECYAEDGPRTVARIVEISDAGRAPRNDAAIFALAMGAAHKDERTRQEALSALSKVCRTSTHLFQFVKASRALGKGFGRAFKRAVADWYTSKPVDAVAYQAIKYRAREGYTHKRLLELSHAPSKADAPRHALYSWIKGKATPFLELPPIVRAHLEAMEPDASQHTRLGLIEGYRLPWEALPTECNADPEVWRAMLPHLGLTALIRNLGNMTRVGAITPLSQTEGDVAARLLNEDDLRKSRIHPFHVLQAMAVYGSGRGVRGDGTWTPSRLVLDALDSAFYRAFANVEPTGKRHLLALDVSGSMSTPLMGSPLSCRDATAALALVTMATETNVGAPTHVVGFTSSGHSARQYGGRWGGGQAALTALNISPRQRLTDAVRAVSNLPFGGTDCALPMLYAMEKGLSVDVFLIFTDSETWAGQIHPAQALRQYRSKSGIQAKLIVVGMTSSGFSIADPSDGGMLDCVGFDTSVPQVIADFASQ